jgi:hypothetical protein
MSGVRPRHIGHVYEVIRTLAGVLQVILTVLILLRVYGVS